MEKHVSRAVALDLQGTERRWSLYETNNAGERVSDVKWEVWDWSFHFQAVDLAVSFECRMDRLGSSSVADERNIQGKLQLKERTRFEMFGTDRRLTNFSFILHPAVATDDESEVPEEKCWVTGGVSFADDEDWPRHSMGDFIEFLVYVSPERFDRIERAVIARQVERLLLSVSHVPGLYAPWSPSIDTDVVKVLTRADVHQVAKPEGCEIEPPILGPATEWSIGFVLNRTLIEEEDEDDDWLDDDDTEKPPSEQMQATAALRQDMVGLAQILLQLRGIGIAIVGIGIAIVVVLLLSLFF